MCARSMASASPSSGPGVLDHRAERRRQDDAVQPDFGNLRAAGRPHSARRRRRDRAHAGPARAPRPVAHLPESADLLPHDGDRERHGRPPSPRADRDSRRPASSAVGWPAESRRPAKRRTRRLRASASPMRRASGRLARLWRSQAAGDRARARERAQGAAARRAGGRLQSGRDPGDRRRDPRHRRRTA